LRARDLRLISIEFRQKFANWRKAENASSGRPSSRIDNKRVVFIARNGFYGIKVKIVGFDHLLRPVDEPEIRIAQAGCVRPRGGDACAGQAVLNIVRRCLLKFHEIDHRVIVFKRKRIWRIPEQAAD